MPSWNLELSIACEQSLFWHNIWKECDKPKTGQIVTIMLYTRNHYHDLIRKIKTDRNSAVKRSLGNALQSGQTRNFWSEFYKISKAKGKNCLWLLMIYVRMRILQIHLLNNMNCYIIVYLVIYHVYLIFMCLIVDDQLDIVVRINTVC